MHKFRKTIFQMVFFQSSVICIPEYNKEHKKFRISALYLEDGPLSIFSPFLSLRLTLTTLYLLEI